MPTYEYRCPNCNSKFDKLFLSKEADRNKGVCPNCGTVSPKIISAPNFQFSPYLKELGEGNMVSY